MKKERKQCFFFVVFVILRVLCVPKLRHHRIYILKELRPYFILRFRREIRQRKCVGLSADGHQSAVQLQLILIRLCCTIPSLIRKTTDADAIGRPFKSAVSSFPS